MDAAYIELLEEVRQDSSLLSQYREPEEGADYHLQQERGKLLVALFHEKQLEDYDLVRFLFLQEMELRRREPWKFRNYNIDLLDLSAFLLAQFRVATDLWRFVELKGLDTDAQDSFDTEFLLVLGMEKVYSLMGRTDNPKQFKAARYIGKRIEDKPFTQDELEKWEAQKRAYFVSKLMG